MLDRIVAYARAKPRTATLIAAAVALGAVLLVADAQRGGSLWAFLPLVACVGMHFLMHGGHGHGQAQERGDHNHDHTEGRNDGRDRASPK